MKHTLIRSHTQPSIGDYFLKQWERFGDYPGTVLARSTHLRGAGTYDEIRGERPRIDVTLATGISEHRCGEHNSGYLDPNSIVLKDWEDREDEGVLVVPKAGETHTLTKTHGKDLEMTISWGIIGCGDVTEIKSGPGFQKAEYSELGAVMRRTVSLAEDYAQRHEVPRWYDDAEALIQDPQVDAVYVATPPASHADYALKVCEAGKPVYVEKPMARNSTECEDMLEAFRDAGCKLFVAYYRRALPRFLKAKELIEDGALGRVTSVTYRYAGPHHRSVDPDNLEWRLRAAVSGGGLFMDLGSHNLDILDFLLGQISQVEGVAANVASDYDVEDTVAMSFITSSGVPGCASWNFASAVSEDLMEVAGTEGRLLLSTFGNEPVRLESGSGVESFNLPNPPHVHQPLIQTIVDEISGRGECPSTGESALRTARVMDQVVDAYYGGRHDVFWERPDTWPGRRTASSSR